MLKQLTVAVLTTLAFAGTAYADTCPLASSFNKVASGYEVAGPNGPEAVEVDPSNASETDVKSLKFTAARLKEKDGNSARVVCQYEDGKTPVDIAATTVWRTGKPTQTDGGNWQGDDCATKDGDVHKCAFKH
ncbi:MULTISPECIES: hypothetical protein [unclassified Pseudomonas]|uniref:hypothetical protein n=1 Tax=unclassified Pseudomonas TaxID=196821 RepID=UPI000A1F0679|nr:MULTISPECIES: hypothetical protein [unclassified Pseudomonas]MDI2141612.1 hypothetical protein [Pseudomonas sp. ITA]